MALKPGILWIVTTQWRAQACGYAGDRNARTPCLDALAAESINYTQAVTPHPFGPFARAALLTGMASPENGIRDYFDPLPSWSGGAGRRAGNSVDGSDQPGWTVAHALNARGYATGFFGKWHLGKRDPGEPLVGEAHARMIVPPTARGGFAHWEGFESGFLLNDPWLHGTGFAEPRQFGGYQSDVVCDRAAAWIRPRLKEAKSGRDTPWFCVVSLEPPHPPYGAPAAGIAARSPAEIVLPPNVPCGGPAEMQARSELAGYYAHIEATDRAIGRLLAAVDAAANAGGGPRPIVVFTSVHGDMHGAHGLFRKGWPHEESVRVPLLVRAPAAHARDAGSGVSSFELVSLLDLGRWTIEWAQGHETGTWNAKPGPGVQRISMPSVVALPHQCERVWRGVRTRSRKLVLNADGSPWLCFDLEHDPHEERNLVGDPAARAEIDRLRAEI